MGVLKRAWDGLPLSPVQRTFVKAVEQIILGVLVAVIAVVIDALVKGPIQPSVLWPLVLTAALGALLNVLLKYLKASNDILQLKPPGNVDPATNLPSDTFPPAPPPSLAGPSDPYSAGPPTADGPDGPGSLPIVPR